LRQVEHSLLQPRLRVRDGAIVDRRADLFEEEVKQQPGRQIAQRLRHIFFKIALQRGDRLGSDLFCEFDRHREISCA
jgi:hypothetical protein